MDEFVFFAVVILFVFALSTCSEKGADKVNPDSSVACFMHGNTGCKK